MSYLDIDLKSDNNRPKFKPPNRERPNVKPIRLIKAIFTILTLSLLGYLSLSFLFTLDKNNPLSINESLVLAEPKIKSVDKQKKPLSKAIKTLGRTVKIKNGDTLSSIFYREGISASVLYKIVSQSKHGDLLKNVRQNQTLDILIENQRLSKLTYIPNITKTITFTRNENNKFESSIHLTPLESIPTYREGVINSSLFLAAAKNNIPETVIMNLVGIFGWDIDFALDIRKGDRFKLIYDELYQKGIKIKTGRILAAEFINNSKVYQAVYFKNKDGQANYFSPDGKSMRKAFLRNPVKFSRISSRFTNSRWHPVLGKKRPHKGVDYAASKGTPVFAAGDGKIIYRANKGGYGRTVIIKHGGKYTTLYAHLNAFNRKSRRGSRVKQGQTIGYVGKSGLATGYHLHYEFRLSGVHRNPLTISLPAAKPINSKYGDDFLDNKNRLLHMLNLMESQKHV